MKRFLILITLTALIAVGSLSALTVKLGSPFPEGTEWDTTLKRMASEWADITGGQIRMRIYPGGVAGDDGDMTRKMRFGQLDAAVLTTFGLKSIVPNSFVFSLPGLLRSEAELEFVVDELTNEFNDDFIAEGFRVLSWSQSGWAYFYAKGPSITPNQMRNEKLAVSSSDEELAANFKALRFNVVPTSLSELMVSLQSGLVTAFYGPPMAAAAYQWFAQAQHMIDFAFAPVLGGLVISERTWQRIPQRYHRELQDAIDKVSKNFFNESARLNGEAMRVMKNNGLVVHTLSDSQRSDWFDVLTSGHELVVGNDKWIDPDIYKWMMSRLETLR